MAILAGIDEAGYGPILGPLVVSCVAMRVPDDIADHSIWDTLRDSVTDKQTRSSRKRLAVADSKKLFRSRASIVPLERAALVMLAAAGRRPKTWHGFLKTVAPHVVDQLDNYPWYREVDYPLPTHADVGDAGIQANVIRLNCRQQSVQLLGMFCEPMLEGAFNRLVKNTRNKAVVLMGLVLRLVERVIQLGAKERIRVCVDRLGGRQHYRDVLMTNLPEYAMQIVEESEERSAYRLTRRDARCDIEFATNSEDRHFCVALASVYSKYLRELFMHAFNTYWSSHLPDIRPTAGYYTDAQRWLTEAGEMLDRVGVDRTILVRQR